MSLGFEFYILNVMVVWDFGFTSLLPRHPVEDLELTDDKDIAKFRVGFIDCFFKMLWWNPGFLKCQKFLEQLKNSQLLEKYHTPWDHFVCLRVSNMACNSNEGI